MKTFALTLMLFALPALADDTAPAPAPNIGSKLLEFVSPGGVATLLGVVASLVGGLAFMTTRRKRIVASVLHRAYQGVNDIAATDEVTDGWDKTAAFLKEADKRLTAMGWRPLNPDEQEQAKLEASALHGAEQQAIKIASAAAEAGARARPQ